MIIRNNIRFGYGDIAITADPLTQKLIFRQIKSKAECGCILSNNVEFVGDPIIFKIDYYDYCELNNLFNNIKNRIIKKFTFKDYTFDFSNYDEKSIIICKNQLNVAIHMYLRCIAV